MGKPLRVLILEDTPDDAELVLHELERAGFNAIWHRVATEAAYLDHLDEDWDVILADYTLTQFNALRALELLKERRFDIPFIVVTGSIGEEVAVNCIKQGATDYLLKDRLARLGLAVEHALQEKHHREERRRTREQLLLQTKALQAAANSVVITNREGTVLWVNPAFTRLTGYDAGEVIGHNPSLLKSGYHTPTFYNDLWKTILAGESWHGELVNRRKDGSLYSEEMTITPVRSYNGEITHFIAIKQDVTARKRSEEEREVFVQELEARNAELERFTYTVSHDLKSPLVTITGFLGLLQQDVARGDEESVQRDTQQIQKAATKMQQLLDELLDLSRIGRRINPSEAVSLTELANDAIDLVAGRIAARGVTVHIEPDMPMVFVDRIRLVEVFQNLIDNAVKFVGNQPTPRVEIGVRQNGAEQVCYVRDNGIGIDPQYHERIFGLFEQLDADEENTGIGLALVKRIVEVHEGRVWVESEGLGHGSTFCFTLPRDRL